MHFVKGERIDCPDHGVLALLLFPVALEAEVILVSGLWPAQVYLDDADAAFNRTDSIALARGKACNDAGRLPKWAVDQMHRIEVLLCNKLQVPDVNLLVRVARDHQRELAAHLMDRFPDVCLANLGELHVLYRPELDHGVPSGANQKALPVHCEGVHILHWQVVLSDGLRLHSVLVRIPHLDCVVRVGDEDGARPRCELLLLLVIAVAKARLLLLLLLSFLEADSQDRASRVGESDRLELRRLVHGLARASVIVAEAGAAADLLWLDRVDLDLAVPRGHGADFPRPLHRHHYYA